MYLCCARACVGVAGVAHVCADEGGEERMNVRDGDKVSHVQRLKCQQFCVKTIHGLCAADVAEILHD